tara:strand:- start:1204 stop:1446 length:243 start_codon:yes stop_codon:yes gene_type:complete
MTQLKTKTVTQPEAKVVSDPCALCGHSIKELAISKISPVNGKMFKWEFGHNGAPRVNGLICDVCHGGDEKNALRRLRAGW